MISGCEPIGYLILNKHRDNDLPDGEAALFRDAVRGATPLQSAGRNWHRTNQPPPVPIQSLLDGHDALAESMTGALPWDPSVQTGEEPFFLRLGLSHDLLRKLRRGHWVAQDMVDLHGLNRVQARLRLVEFLQSCLRRGLRCVRVVHGKGLRSPGREPVLKGMVLQWLARRDEVLAFSQAPGNQGGSGALLLLLKAR
jgi:DNA-nicking Smr family endonuclease